MGCSQTQAPKATVMRLNFRTALSLTSLALLSACSGLSMDSLPSLPSVTGDKVLGLVRPYRVEVVQGNVLT